MQIAILYPGDPKDLVNNWIRKGEVAVVYIQKADFKNLKKWYANKIIVIGVWFSNPSACSFIQVHWDLLSFCVSFCYSQDQLDCLNDNVLREVGENFFDVSCVANKISLVSKRVLDGMKWAKEGREHLFCWENVWWFKILRERFKARHKANCCDE